MARNSDTRNLLVLLVGGLAVLVLVPALFMGFGMMGIGGMMGGGWGGHMWGDTGGGWYPLIGVAMQFVFLLVVLAGGYLLLRTVVDGDDGTDPAIEELRSAYARGDLSEEEYERRREALERDRG